jgi:hypothetical protein
MPFGSDTSTPTRFLKGQSPSDNRALALELFGGEVLAAFEKALIFRDKVEAKSLNPGEGKSWRFPKVWKAISEYHTPGQEMLGNSIPTGEISVSVDDILVAHTAISDLDTMLTHFDIRSKFSSALGIALARTYDENLARALILAARTAASGPFPGGSVLADNTLKATAGVFNGAAWVEAIKAANVLLYNKDVPEDMPRYLVVPRAVFDAIKYAKDTDGNYLVLDRDFGVTGNAGGIGGRGNVMNLDGVTIMYSKSIPQTNQSADATVYPKYQADYSKTLGIFWAPMATATVTMRDIALETTRDTRRLEDFMVASNLVGHGTLRPECAVEIGFVS